MTTLIQPSSPASVGSLGFREVDPDQVRRWLDGAEAVLVDVREADEHAREHIAGTRLVPLSRFDASAAAAGVRPGQWLVFHCKSGRRSGDACRLSGGAAPGVSIANLSGGIEAWKRAGLPVETNVSVARLSVMRQVQLTIGVCVVTGAALAWFVHPAFVVVPAFFGAGLVFAGATGTCGLAALLGMMPWNRAGTAGRSDRR